MSFRRIPSMDICFGAVPSMRALFFAGELVGVGRMASLDCLHALSFRLELVVSLCRFETTLHYSLRAEHGYRLENSKSHEMASGTFRNSCSLASFHWFAC